MAITQNTKDADDQLRKALKHADLGKFKKAFKKILAPTEKKDKSTNTPTT